MQSQGAEGATSNLASLPTTALSDALVELGFPDQTLPAQISPLARGMTLAGPAFPVEGRATADVARGASIAGIVEMLSSVPARHVVVYQANDGSSAHLGDISVTALQSRGCVGAVVDGGCRDVESVLESGFPVFCRYVTAQDAAGRWQVLDWGRRITVGPVAIEPGDLVVGDANGVVVVPHAAASQVAVRGRELLVQEEQVRRELAGGMSPREVLRKFSNEG